MGLFKEPQWHFGQTILWPVLASRPNHQIPSSNRKEMNSIIPQFLAITMILQLALARPSSDSEPDNLLLEEEVKFPGASVKGPFTAHFIEWLIE